MGQVEVWHASAHLTTNSIVRAIQSSPAMRGWFPHFAAIHFTQPPQRILKLLIQTINLKLPKSMY